MTSTYAKMELDTATVDGALRHMLAIELTFTMSQSIGTYTGVSIMFDDTLLKE